MKKQSCYYLYNKPRPGSRTGHCALFIGHLNRTNPELSEGIYFSLYHDYKPSDIKSMGLKALFLGVKPYIIDSIADDLIMRGQSAQRYQIREKEDIRVSKILATLPTQLKQKQAYIKLGVFDSALELTGINVSIAKSELLKLKQNLRWTPFSLISSAIMRSPNTHNCASAIWTVINNSRPKQNRVTQLLSDGSIIYLYLALLVGAALLPTDYFASNNSGLIACLPIALYLASCMKNALKYTGNVFEMARQSGKLDLKTIAWVVPLSLFINLIGSPFSNDSSAKLFMTPGSVYTMFKSTSLQQKPAEIAKPKITHSP